MSSCCRLSRRVGRASIALIKAAGQDAAMFISACCIPQMLTILNLLSRGALSETLQEVPVQLLITIHGCCAERARSWTRVHD